MHSYVCALGVLRGMCTYLWVGTGGVEGDVYIQYGTRKRLRSILLARHMYDCIVSNYAGIHGVNTIERRYGINYHV